MNTTISNKISVTAPKAAVTVTSTKTESAFWKKAEEARFGILPLLLTLISCLGGVAAAFGTGYNVVPLAMVTVPMMLTLSFILAVAPMRLIVWSGVVAVLFDLVVLFL